MTTDSINDIERDAKRADQLTVGDFILENSGGVDEPHKVLAAVPYLDGNRNRGISVMLDPPFGGEPYTTRYRPDKYVDLATEAELAKVHDEARRHEVVEGLRDLVNVILTRKVRFGTMGPAVTFSVPAGEADRLAEALGLPVERFGDGTDAQVVWTAPTGDERGMPLHATFWGRWAEPEKPAEPTDDEIGDEIDRVFAEPGAEQPHTWFFTFGAGQEFDGRYVVMWGTWASTRSRMNRIFGHAWCAQYEVLPAECAEMTELEKDEWPAHAEATEVPTQQAGE